jgi:hypothetical protein
VSPEEIEAGVSDALNFPTLTAVVFSLRLYERLGFREEKTEEFEFLRGLLGFGASTTKTLKL